MIDQSRPAPGEHPVPAFTPVPRACSRHDGWTPERQQGFLTALVETGSVRAAALAVNMASEGAYQLRRHPEAGSFRAAWDEALALGVQRLEDLAMERALHGTEEPVYSYGKLIGTRRRYNDRLLMFLLRNRAPERFAASAARPGMVALAELERLKAQWRAEWEKEARAATPYAAPDDFDLPLDPSPSPRTAMLTAQAQLSYDEDCRRGHDWWKKPWAEYDDRTRPGDYPPIDEDEDAVWAEDQGAGAHRSG